MIKQWLINILEEQPFSVTPGQKVNKALFYSLLEENFAKITNVGDNSEKNKVAAAEDIISLCRAAIVGFVAQGDLRSVHDVLDYFSPCATEIIKTAKARPRGAPKDIKDTQKHNVSYLPEDELQLEPYNILYLPRSQVEKVKQMLGLITEKEPRKEYLLTELLAFAAQRGFKSDIGLDLQYPEIVKDKALWDKGK